MEMKKEQLKDLAYLLTEFIVVAETGSNSGSVYGKKMDVAVAEDMMSSLLAYGLDYQTFLTLKSHLQVMWNLTVPLNDVAILIPVKS